MGISQPSKMVLLGSTCQYIMSIFYLLRTMIVFKPNWNSLRGGIGMLYDFMNEAGSITFFLEPSSHDGFVVVLLLFPNGDFITGLFEIHL